MNIAEGNSNLSVEGNSNLSKKTEGKNSLSAKKA